MTRLLAICLVLLGLSSATSARAGIENAGTTGANFLSIGSGASILSMGGATLGLGSDLNAVNWNVAALGGLAETQFALSHTGLEDQSNQEWAAAGGRIGHTQTRWALSGLFQSDGVFDGRDQFNNPTGSFGASSMALGMQVAQPLGSMVRVGGGFKWVGEHLGDVSGSGLTFDAGVQARSGMFGIGLAAQNLGGSMKYQSTSAPFPSNVGMGVAMDHPSGVRVALDANFPSAYYKDVRMGAEWNWKQRLAVRAGYRKELGAPAGERLSGPSFGLGSGTNGVWVDYGYVVAGGGGTGEHRLGLSFRPSMLNAGPQGLGVRPALEPTVEPAPAPKAVRKPKDEPKDEPKAEPKAEKRSKHARETVVEPVETTVPVAPKKKSAEPSSVEAPKPIVQAPVTPKLAEPMPKPVATPAITKPIEIPAPVKPPVTIAPPAPKPVETPAISKPVEAPPAAKPIQTPAAPKPAVVVPSVVTPPAPQPQVAKPIATPVNPPAVVKPAETAPVAPAPKPEAKSLTPVTPPTEAPKPAVTPVVEPKPETIVPPISTAPRFVPSKPAPAPVVAAAPATPVQRPAKVSVKRGETMASIAKLYGTSVAAIMMENNFVTDQVKPGQTIRLPKAK